MFAFKFITLVLAIVPPVPPVIDLPVDLELCIHKAEICIADAALDTFDICSSPTSLERDDCIENYEDCSSEFAEAGESSCRTAHVWCVLEDNSTVKDLITYCEAVAAVCATG